MSEIFQTSPHTVDTHVGRRVRGRRKELNMSQLDLAAALGLTFQQIQKYERGFNRISASKLHEIAQHLSVRISYFFVGLDDSVEEIDTDRETFVGSFLSTAEGLELSRYFVGVKSPVLRRRLLDLVKALADNINREDRKAG